jgi:hypothetical protein
MKKSRNECRMRNWTRRVENESRKMKIEKQERANNENFKGNREISTGYKRDKYRIERRREGQRVKRRKGAENSS